MLYSTFRWMGLSLFGLVLGVSITPPVAAQSGETGNVCVRDYQSGAVCRANDVRIEELSAVSVVEDCSSGVQGSATIVFQMLVSADGSPDRYDVGAFLALDGGSARDGDSCFHDFLNPPITATPSYGDVNMDLVPDVVDGPWADLESDVSPVDTCGDIEGGTQVIKTLQQLTVACVDSNFDGSVDVSVCASWDNNRSGTCNGVTTAFPGTNSKCGCSLLELGIPPPGPSDAPAIAVSKTPLEQSVLLGEDAIFTINVDNAGDTNLELVNVDDPLCTTLTGPTGDTGGDSVLGTDETWTYECTVANVTADFVNTVTVSASPGDADPISDSATASVAVIAPAITVNKLPTEQTVNPGGSAEFTIEVQSTGNVDLESVVFEDDQCTSLSGPSGDDGDLVLEVGETWSYTCTIDPVDEELTNIASATGTPPVGPDVEDSGSAAVFLSAVTNIPTLSGALLGVFALLLGVGAVMALGIGRGSSG